MGNSVARESRPQPEFRDIVSSLRQSALFHLSLSNKELFHSNFLAWLCDRVPPAARILFGAEFGDASSRWDRVRLIAREANNLDLVITVGNSEFATDTLVIENKVKSIPMPEQLIEYREAVRNRPEQFPGHQHFLLLTLDPEDAKGIDTDKLGWRVLGYGELARRLHLLPRTDLTPYHAGLIDDYANLARRLAELAMVVGVDHWSEPPPEVRKLRLHDLVLKRCAAHVGDHLLRSLRAAFPEARVARHAAKDTRRSPGDIYVYDGMNRAKATVGCFLILPSNAQHTVLLGVGFQIEGGQFRSYIEVMPKDSTAINSSKGHAQRAGAMFEKSPCADWWVPGEKSAGRKDECGYGRNFVYRYQKLATVLRSAKPEVHSMVAEIVERMNGVKRHAAELAAQWHS